MKSSHLSFIALTPLLILALSACVSLAQDVTPPPGYQAPIFEDPPDFSETFPLVAPNPETGAGIYSESCAPCHGDTGLGDGPTAGQLRLRHPPLGHLKLRASLHLRIGSRPSLWVTSTR